MAFKMKGNPMGRNFGIGKPAAKMMGKKKKSETEPMQANYNKVFKQDESDLKEYLMDEKGFNQEDADKQIADGAASTSDKDFLAWYRKTKKKDTAEAKPKAEGKEGGSADAMQAMMGMMGGAGGGSPMALKGKQKNLDKNNNGKIDAEDFKLLKKKKKKGGKKEEKDTTMKAYGKKPKPAMEMSDDKKPAMEMSHSGKKDKKDKKKKDKKKPPLKGYKSAAQRKAVHASKADGGKGHPDKKKKKKKKA